MYAKKARGQERGKPLWALGLPIIAVADTGKFCGSSWDLGLKQNGLALAYNICLASLCMSCEIILYNLGFVYSLFFILQLIILISICSGVHIYLVSTSFYFVFPRTKISYFDWFKLSAWLPHISLCLFSDNIRQYGRHVMMLCILILTFDIIWCRNHSS